MVETVKVRVDKSLQEALENFRKTISLDIKKKYNIDEITIYGTLASKILAAKMNGKKFIEFRIKKNGLNKGILELV